MLRFEWDEEKDDENRRKHGVAFSDAHVAFADDNALVLPDEAHSVGEERFILLGMTPNAGLLVVVYTERMDGIRIISSRQAGPREERAYRDQKNRP